MKTIGFANKFYTLWDVTTEPMYSTIITANGAQHYPSGTRYICTYIKNVSTDITKVQSLYPDLSIDESLRGMSNSFDWSDGYVKMEYAKDVFAKGYNKGMAISTCNDLRELKWAYVNESDEERLVNIANALKSIGAHIYNGIVYDTEELMNIEIKKQNKLREEKDRVANMYDEMINGGTITIEMNKNLSAKGVMNVDGVLYSFKDYIVSFYNGHTYGLPAINGKGKRVKGKNLELTVKTGEYYNEEFDENYTALIVESFKILS